MARQQVTLLRVFRNGNNHLFGDVEMIKDLGIKHAGDSVQVWSRNRKALIQLKDYFERAGFETTGVW